MLAQAPFSCHLDSDFHDYYDHWFDSPHQVADRVLIRRSDGGMDRRAMLAYLETLGLNVPQHGLIRELVPRLQAAHPGLTDMEGYDTLADVVVYLDEQCHRGEGKIKLNWREALARYPDHYGSEHIPANGAGLGVSLRYLQIGHLPFWLEYRSANDWRSNCGEVTVKLLSTEQPRSRPAMQEQHIVAPLFAVDFVVGERLYAVDFNVAPQVRGTGIEQQLPAREAYLALMGALDNSPGQQDTSDSTNAA